VTFSDIDIDTMILILTLNPLLERRFNYKKLNLSSVNRYGIVNYQAGGKGINVSRQLKKLGIDSFNLFFSGGNNGKIFRDLLRKENLNFSFINIEQEIREAAIIISEEEEKVYSFFSSNPVIIDKEINQMKLSLNKIIPNIEMIVISGSSPFEEAEEIIEYAILEANKYDKVVLCDYYGKNLSKVFSLSPTIIHNNFDEIENYLGVSIENENLIIDFLKSLYQKGIKRVYLTNGEKTFYAQNFDYLYKVFPPKVKYIDPTGSGDAFVAGLIYCWKNNEIFELSVKFSSSLGAINAARFDVCNVEKSEIEDLIDKVNIVPVGKKIKIINDKPTFH
jgi:1-phosphofructokinase family hexose kinase